MRRVYKLILVIVGVMYLSVPRTIFAAPYFFLQGDAVAVTGTNQTWKIKLFTDNQTVTAAQTVFNFDPDLLSPIQISNINSLCSFWAPADPTLGFGSASTPYYSGGNKVVVSCGFSNPGYKSAFADGDLILNVILKPIASGSATLRFTNNQFRYIGTVISPGASPDFELGVYGSTVEAELARPTPVPTAVATASAGSSTSSTPQPSPDTLTASDLTLVDITKNTSSRRTTGTNTGTFNQNLDVVETDNTIPAPPTDMTPRPKATPYIYKSSSGSAEPYEGEVLSLQSLRELLIPGKSQADKTLVLFNLISTLTFVTLLAVLIWRMIVSSRSNQLKYRHMNELIEGELAVLETKLEGVKAEKPNIEFGQSLDQLKKELEKAK